MTPFYLRLMFCKRFTISVTADRKDANRASRTIRS